MFLYSFLQVLERHCERWGVKMKVLEVRYDLERTYKHHKKASRRIRVDFARFTFADDKTRFKALLQGGDSSRTST